MAITVSELEVRIKADTDDVERGLRRADRSVSQFAGNIDKTGAALAGVFGGAGFAAAAAGMAGLSRATKVLGGAVIGANADIETVRAQLMAFTKDAGKTDAIL